MSKFTLMGQSILLWLCECSMFKRNVLPLHRRRVNKKQQTGYDGNEAMFCLVIFGKKPMKIEMNEAKTKWTRGKIINAFESLVTYTNVQSTKTNEAHDSFVGIERELQNDKEFTSFVWTQNGNLQSKFSLSSLKLLSSFYCQFTWLKYKIISFIYS